MIVRWTEKAFVSLERITLHIADDNPEADIRTVQTIYARIEELGKLVPKIGKLVPENWCQENRKIGASTLNHH